MSARGCDDRIRFSLSDKSGALCFESFDIIDQPECADVVEKLRGILLGRSLAEIDVDEIRAMSCPGGTCCMRDVAKVIDDSKDVLVHEERSS